MGSSPLAHLVAGVCFLLAALAYVRQRQIGGWLGAAGVAILSGALAARGLQAGHWPLVGSYEFALAFALGTALAALTVPLGTQHHETREGAAAVRAVALVAATMLLAYARLGLPEFKRAIQPMSPALNSIWLPLHVATASLAYGALAVAGTAAMAWLVKESYRTGAERVLDGAIAAGYPLLTCSMLLGMIWAQVAWGRYWGWDTKEVWALITWLVYTLYWHLRRRPRWQGRRLAWLALVGLGAVLFTSFGIESLARAVGLESLYLFLAAKVI
jgi:ABC-type transport system involved in cytochrome c biogenesis permease subunit